MVKLPPPEEKDVQADIVKLFGYLGCEVLTIHTTAFCRRGHPAKTYGASQGKPDLLVRRKSWPLHIWLALEVKRDDKAKWANDEQKRLCLSGAIARVESAEDAKRAYDYLCGVLA